MNRILFSVALLMVTASVWGQGDATPPASLKAHRKAVEKRLGKQADYYALRYTYSSPTMPGGVRKGAGVATHLKLYDPDGTYIGTISQGDGGKYHSPMWMMLTGTLKKEDTATSRQRFIKGADLPDILLSNPKQMGIGQPDSVLKIEMQKILGRVQQAVGKDWTVTAYPAPQPNPGPAGGARGFVIAGVSKTLKTAAGIPGQKRIDPKKKEPAKFWVAAYGSYSSQCSPKTEMHSWQGWSSTREYHGSAWLQDRRIREPLFSKLRNALDAHWGPTVNGLRMRLAASPLVKLKAEELGKSASGALVNQMARSLPKWIEIQNCSNNPMAVFSHDLVAIISAQIPPEKVAPVRMPSQPGQTVTLRPRRSPKNSCTVQIAYRRFQLQPGQTVSISVDMSKARYGGSNPTLNVIQPGDRFSLRCRTAIVKKGDNWKTMPLPHARLTLWAVLPLPKGTPGLSGKTEPAARAFSVPKTKNRE